MPGGKGNIKPEDGKQFEKGNKAAEKWNEDEALRLANDMLSWMRDADKNIFFEDFLFLSCDESKYKGKIHRDLPAYLSKKFSSFSEILWKCKVIEKVKLMKFGVLNKLNGNVVKFLLSAQYGMTEKSKVDNTSSDGSMSQKPTIVVSSEKAKKTLNDILNDKNKQSI